MAGGRKREDGEWGCGQWGLFFLGAFFVVAAIVGVVFAGLNFGKLTNMGKRAAPALYVCALTTTPLGEPGTSTPIKFNTVRADHDGTYSPSTGLYTVHKEGTYSIRFHFNLFMIPGKVYAVGIWHSYGGSPSDTLLYDKRTYYASPTNPAFAGVAWDGVMENTFTVALRKGEHVWVSVGSTDTNNDVLSNTGMCGANFMQITRIDDNFQTSVHHNNLIGDDDE